MGRNQLQPEANDGTQRAENPTQADSSNRMASDVYTLPMAPPDGRYDAGMRAEAYDRVAMRPQDVRGALQNVVGHLENASNLVGTRGMRAALSEYSAAIYAADQIDQRAVAQEREFVRQQLQSGNLDQQQRRALLQEDADLHTLQRAPGFARANLALVYIRSGFQADGIAMLMDAQQCDPEMRQDPNFRRHLAQALRAGQRAYTEEQAPMQAPQPPRVYDQAGNPVQQRQGDQQVVQNNPQPRPGDVQTTTDQTDRRFSPTDSQGRSPLQVAKWAFDQVTSPQALTPQLRQQFEQAIAASDQGVSPRAQALTDSYSKSLQSTLAALPEATKNQVAAIDNQAVQLISQLPADQQNIVKNIYGKLEFSASEAERKALEGQLVQMVPGLAPMIQQRDQLLGTEWLKKLYETNAIRNDLADEINQGALTRYAYALALQKAGDTQNAQKYLVEAGQKNKNPELVEQFQRTAQSMGLTADKIQPVQQQTDAATVQQQQQTAAGQKPASIELLLATKANFDKATDKAAAVQQLGPEYQRAIGLADNEFNAANAKLTELQKQFQTALTPEIQAKLKELEAKKETEAKKLTPEALAQLQSLYKPETTDQQRATIVQTLTQQYPELVKTMQAEEEVKKPLMPLMQQIAQAQATVQMEQDAKFLTRMSYADALQQGGDKANATKFMNDAINSVPQAQRADYTANAEVAALMKKLEIAAPVAQPGQPGTTTGDGTQLPKPGDANTPTAGLSELATKNTFSDLVQLAAMKAKGGLKDCAPYYEAAIQRADAEFNPQQIAQKIQSLQTALETGKYKDAQGVEKPVTAEDRLQAHTAILQMLQQARAGMDVREEYAQMLKAGHQYKDAEKQLLAAKDAADKLPIALIRKEVELLNKDSTNAEIPELTRAKMNQLAGNVQKLTQTPLQIRYEIGRFYLGGGKNPDGSPIGDQQITGYDKNGQPIVEVIDTKQVNPEGAKKIVDELVAKQKEINGIDVEKEPKLDQNLAALRVATLENSPEGLKKKIKDSGKYWEDANSTFWSTAAGLTVAAGILIATKGEGAAFAERSTMALLGAGAAGFGTATGVNYGMHRFYYGDKDYGLGDAALQGGGTFAAAYGLLAYRNIQQNFKGSAFTEEVVGKHFVEQYAALGKQPTANALLQEFQALKVAAPTKLVELAARNGDEVLTATQIGEAIGMHGYQGVTLLSKVFPQAAQTLKAAEAAATAAQPGGLMAATENGTQVLGNTANVATDAATSNLSTWGKISNWAQSGPAISPFSKFDAAVIPTSGALRASNFSIGFGSAMTFNTLNTGFAATKDWTHGVVGPDGKPITPWSAVTNNMFTFTTPDSPLPFGLNPRNMILQSALMAPFLGSTKIGAPLYKNPITAFNEARGPITAFREAKSPILAFQEAHGLGKITAPLGATIGKVTAPVGATFGKVAAPISSQLAYGGRTALNFMNPGGADLTMFQAIRQANFVPFAYFGANQLVEGHLMSKQGDIWKEVLDRTAKPIANDAPFTPPTKGAEATPQPQQAAPVEQPKPADTKAPTTQKVEETNPQGDLSAGGVQ